MNYHVEFFGGLGDILMQVLSLNRYRQLESMQPDDTAFVLVSTVNPFADELFKWHRHADKMTVRLLPHWRPEQDADNRQRYGLPKAEMTDITTRNPVVFYPSPEDEVLLASIPKPYIVLSPSAGGSARNIPDALSKKIVELATGYTVVQVGRNYRHQNPKELHKEPVVPGTMSLVDKLSVPGTCKLIDGAAGVVCTHSAICLYAWRKGKPTLLLYPKFVYDKHLAGQTNLERGYMFGATRPDCIHTLFDSATESHVNGFLSLLP
jgi:hypothetical protein